jgi:DNA-directed RNA polymerase specialized sigma24 family protein
VLSIAPSTVKAHLARALAALREVLIAEQEIAEQEQEIP